MKLFKRLVLLGCVVVLTACGTTQYSKNSITYKPRATDVWDRIRSGYGMEPLDTKLVTYWENYYTKNPALLKRISSRSSKYIYYIVESIEKRGLPMELALLPIVESAYKPKATSIASAAGLWQFIPSTGRHYELSQTWWSDERRDPKESTDAALDYLSSLYREYHSWHLSLAAYNWGGGSVNRAIKRAKAKGLEGRYEQLKMPKETANYVPKLIALSHIVKNPKKYGVTLDPIPNKPYFQEVPVDQNMDAQVIAELADITLEEFYDLNPGHYRPQISSKTHHILLPVESLPLFKENLASYRGDLTDWELLPTKRGESFEKIAKQRYMTLKQLQLVNGLSSRTKISKGQNILVARHDGVKLSEEYIKNAPKLVERRKARYRMISHKVRRGETLSRIARRYHMTVKELKRVNHLRSSRIRVGRIIKVRRVAYKTSARGRTYATSHKVRRGETLSSIARRYHTSVKSLKRLNHLRSSNIRVGRVIKVQRGRVKSNTRTSSRVISHKVRRGETLSSIARRYHMTVSELKKLNHLRGSSIRAGRVIKVRRK